MKIKLVTDFIGRFRRKPEILQYDQIREDAFHDDVDQFSLSNDPDEKLFAAHPKSKKTEKRPPLKQLLVGTLRELKNLEDAPPERNVPIILTGDLILLSDNQAGTPDHYHQQPDRITKSLRLFAKSAVPLTLKVWLHEEAIATSRRLDKHRFYFGIDQYLRQSNKNKGTHILVTGYASDIHTIIHVFQFDHATLIGITEKTLPVFENQRFSSDFASLLEGLRRSKTPVTVAAPLPDPEDREISYVGNTIYQRPIQYPIVDHDAKPSIMTSHGLSIVMFGLALSAYLMAVLVPYNDYEKAADQFRRVAAALPQNELSFGSNQLKTMQERRFFLTEPKTQQHAATLLQQITRVLASEGVVIKEISLILLKRNPEDPDVSFTIQMPKKEISSLDQVKPVIDHISEKLGMRLHLAHNGYREVSEPRGKAMQYIIQGNLKRD